MRPKLFACIIVIVGFLCAILLSSRERDAALPRDTFQNVQDVIVQDDWEGVSQFSPRILHGQFRRSGMMWKGQVFLSVTCRMRQHGQWKDCCAHTTTAASIPDAVMQQIFRRLNQIPLRKGTYEAVQTTVQDFPQPLLMFRSPTRTLTFRSESNTPQSIPWAVQNANDKFVTQSAIPDDTLRLLRPFLHEEELPILEAKASGPQNIVPPPMRVTHSNLYAAKPVSDVLKWVMHHKALKKP